MRPQIARARAMRANLSRPEVVLWSRLKRLRERGYHFRRQAPFKGYYLDFVYYPYRLVIEVDGFQHGEDRQANHDAVRDAVLRRHGFTVLRFWSSDVRHDTDRVMDQIVRTLAASSRVHGRDVPQAQSLDHTSPP
ncbi:endonuclease domain-containing protein [Phenylobacterium sp.]|uniref:endonuclease domain-containing protein n=1 Tax=Phenylobacterium sp. TaxID=1871053 RepID=UPI003D2C43A0